MSEPTKSLAPIMINTLISDSSERRSGNVRPTTQADVYASLKKVRSLVARETVVIPATTSEVDDRIEITFLRAGHVLGACMVYVACFGKTLLYTGDFNATPDRHLGAYDILPFPPSRIVDPSKPLDVLVTESTYGTVTRESRTESERAFTSVLDDVLGAKKGNVLIPSLRSDERRRYSEFSTTTWGGAALGTAFGWWWPPAPLRVEFSDSMACTSRGPRKGSGKRERSPSKRSPDFETQRAPSSSRRPPLCRAVALRKCLKCGPRTSATQSCFPVCAQPEHWDTTFKTANSRLVTTGDDARAVALRSSDSRLTPTRRASFRSFTRPGREGSASSTDKSPRCARSPSESRRSARSSSSRSRRPATARGWIIVVWRLSRFESTRYELGLTRTTRSWSP